MTYKAILWDSDNTLVLSRPLHFRKHQQILSDHYGIMLDPEHEENIYKWNAPQIHDWLSQTHGLTAPRDLYVKQVSDWYTDHAHELQPGPGVPDALAYLKAHKIPMAVVSNGRRASVDVSLGALKAAHLIDVIVTKDDVAHVKPHPEPYLLALSRLETLLGTTLLAEDCLAIDDHEDGIASAKAAGLQTYHIDPADKPDKLFDFLKRAFEF